MVEPVSLPPVIVGDQPPEPVEVPTEQTNSNPLPEEIATQRAAKTAMGSGAMLQKSADDLKYDFMAGKENEIRQTAASAVDFENSKKKQKLLLDYAQKYGALSSAQINKFLDPFAPENQPADPNTVLEKQYARSYIGQLATAPAFLGDENVMDVARREIPKQAEQVNEVADDLTTKNQILLKRIQDAETMAGQQSWLGRSIDFLKDVTQVHQEYIY